MVVGGAANNRHGSNPCANLENKSLFDRCTPGRGCARLKAFHLLTATQRTRALRLAQSLKPHSRESAYPRSGRAHAHTTALKLGEQRRWCDVALVPRGPTSPFSSRLERQGG